MRSCFFYSLAILSPGNASPDARGKLGAHRDQRTTSAVSVSDERGEVSDTDNQLVAELLSELCWLAASRLAAQVVP